MIPFAFVSFFFLDDHFFRSFSFLDDHFVLLVLEGHTMRDGRMASRWLCVLLLGLCFCTVVLEASL